MNRLVLLTFCLLAFTVSGLAQQPSNPQSPTSKKTAEQTMSGSRAVSSSAKQTQHITGCLQQQNGAYVLQEKHGKIANVTSTLDLASQVGHEVTATGTWQPNTAGRPPKGEAKGEVVDNPDQSLVIGHLKILADSCK